MDTERGRKSHGIECAVAASGDVAHHPHLVAAVAGLQGKDLISPIGVQIIIVGAPGGNNLHLDFGCAPAVFDHNVSVFDMTGVDCGVSPRIHHRA